MLDIVTASVCRHPVCADLQDRNKPMLRTLSINAEYFCFVSCSLTSCRSNYYFDADDLSGSEEGNITMGVFPVLGCVLLLGALFLLAYINKRGLFKTSSGPSGPVVGTDTMAAPPAALATACALPQ